MSSTANKATFTSAEMQALILDFYGLTATATLVSPSVNRKNADHFT